MLDSLASGLAGAAPDELVLVAASDLPVLTAAGDRRVPRSGARRAISTSRMRSSANATITAAYPARSAHLGARCVEGRFCGGGLARTEAARAAGAARHSSTHSARRASRRCAWRRSSAGTSCRASRWARCASPTPSARASAILRRAGRRDRAARTPKSRSTSTGRPTWRWQTAWWRAQRSPPDDPCRRAAARVRHRPGAGTHRRRRSGGRAFSGRVFVARRCAARAARRRAPGVGAAHRGDPRRPGDSGPRPAQRVLCGARAGRDRPR